VEDKKKNTISEAGRDTLKVALFQW